MTLNASGSSDPDGEIVEYQWDLNGNGKYETHTSSPELKTSFATEGTENIGLRVIDNHGASANVTHTLTVGNLPPVAKLSASPNPGLVGQTVTLNASESTDQGTITGYKWDLNGEGTYETNTGTTPTVTTSFKTPGTQRSAWKSPIATVSAHARRLPSTRSNRRPSATPKLSRTLPG